MKIARKTTCFLLALTLFFAAACQTDKSYVLSEDTFFLVMTNMLYYPEQYVGADIEYDCFTYEIEDVKGEKYVCGVRKCSSEYGCACGNDTVIGLILSYDGEIPEPRNQRENSPDKRWVHVKGRLRSAEMHNISVYSVDENGNSTGEVETIRFLVMEVAEITEIEDYSGLKWYVTK